MLRHLAIPASLLAIVFFAAPLSAANLVSNPSFEAGTTGWALYGSGSAWARVAGGHTGDFAVRCTGTSSTSLHFGINDNPNWIGTVAGVGTRYRFGCWVRSDLHRGAIKIKVKEFLGSSQKGTTAYSAPVTLSPVWQAVTVDYVVTTAGTTLDLVIEDYPVAGLESYFIDDVSIENVSAPPPDSPPMARLSVAALGSPGLTVRADASASTDTDVTPIASYRFDFGDGTAPVTTSAPNTVAQHTYSGDGTYTVSVIVTDTGGQPSAAASATVTVSSAAPLDDPPVASLSVATLPSPLQVVADGSASTDTDATPIATYQFDFGDGTPVVVTSAPTAVAQHTYADIGSYVVSLIVTDVGGLSSVPATAKVVVTPPNDPPLARLTAKNLSSPPLTVFADASGSTDTDATPIASYRFDFGDGTPPVTTAAPVATAQHTYAAAGTYTISMVATDTDNLSSSPTTATITVTPPNAPPTARLSVIQQAAPPLTVAANGSASTDTDAMPIVSYRFDFGDGTSAVTTTEPTTSAQHTYAVAGTYSVSMIVTDTGGLSSIPAIVTVTVTSTPTPSPVNLVSNPSFEAGTTGWALYGSGSAWARVAGGHTGDFAVRCNGTSSTSLHFGINDNPNWIGTVAGVGTRYRFGCWVRSDLHRGAIKVKVKEFLGSSQKGATAYSAPVTLSPVWQPVTVDYVVTTAGTTLDLVIEDYPVAGLESYFIDDVSIENVSGGTPSVDSPPVARLSVTGLSSPPFAVRADGAASTDTDATAIGSYRFTFGDGTSAVTTSPPNAAAQHTYASPGTYTVTLIATDTGGLASAPVTTSVTVSSSAPPPSSSSVAVYVGYYDTHHPGLTKPKPSPWMGSPGVVFVGRPDNSSGGWDSSALRIVNLTSSVLSGVVVTADIGSKRFALWGTNTIPAGQSLILAQTGFENFDGSDTNPAGCPGCNPNYCVTKLQTTVPVVHLTLGGVTTNYVDTKQILNTHGVDAAGCPYTGTRNDESEAWQLVTPQAALMTGASGLEGAGPSTVPVAAPDFGLALPRPNPTPGNVALRFSLSRTGAVRLDVFDVSGRRVRTLAEGIYEAGDYEARADLSELAQGIYFCSLVTPEGTRHRTFVLMRQ